MSTERHIGLGIPIDVAGLADGKAIVYNEAAGKLEYQTVDGGSAHTHLEADITDLAHDPNVHTHLEAEVTDLTHTPNPHTHLEAEVTDLTHTPDAHTHVEADITDLTHTPPGGGGVDVKSGAVSNLSCGGTQAVLFTTPFTDVPNVACTEDTTAGKEHTITVSNITVNGCTVNVRKAHSGGGCSNVGVHWIATDAGNP